MFVTEKPAAEGCTKIVTSSLNRPASSETLCSYVYAWWSLAACSALSGATLLQPASPLTTEAPAAKRATRDREMERFMGDLLAFLRGPAARKAFAPRRRTKGSPA